MKGGKLIVFSAPSGSGKTTIVQHLLKQEKLNLDLSLRFKISENIPWYAAIFGGIPAVAGGVVFENIFEDAIEDISTINFEVQGTIDEPIINRLN